MTIKRAIFLLLTIFMVRIFFSCCDCDSSETYENRYTDVSIIPYDISGFYPVKATDTVYKNSFGLGVYVNFETIRVAGNNIYPGGLGFSSSMAFECECSNVNYVYPDSIERFEISCIETKNAQKTDVTNHFMINSYSGELISLDEFFEQREEWQDGFEIELEKYDSIPSSAIFEVEVFLNSGKTFVNQTDTVVFYD